MKPGLLTVLPTSVTVLILGMGFSPASLSAACHETKSITHTFPASGIRKLKINALAGRLDLTGVASDEIIINATACSDERQYVDKMSIDIDESSGMLDLTVIIPYTDNDWSAGYAYMDIDVTVPRALEMEIKDSSGDLSAKDVTLTTIDDSSGDIRLENVSGDLGIRDSSGDIRVRGLEGNLLVGDSSGLLDIRDITGNVDIPHDSSGDIEIDTVSGLVTIKRDGSGSIEIENVLRDVTIGSDGSGDIRISQVSGSVIIGADGSGNVRVSQVSGDFLFDSKGSGNIRTKDIKGKTEVPR